MATLQENWGLECLQNIVWLKYSWHTGKVVNHCAQHRTTSREILSSLQMLHLHCIVSGYAR